MPNTSGNNLIIKKDYFIKSRQQDIKQFYEFRQKPLGRGAYGVVYLGKMIQPPFEYRVVKVISKKYVKNPQSLKNQTQILKRLDHPNIIRLYQVFQDQKNLYLVQDFCQGGQLFQKLAEHGNFSQQDARIIFKQIIDIIRYLHQQKICHRDLKPQNFLMNSKDSLEIKLIDFGLAYPWNQNMNEQLIKQKVKSIAGTSYYIAPQILDFNYDQTCDTWSAGVLLYILATATPPFDGQNDKDIMNSVRKMKFTFQNQQAIGLSTDLKDLIAKILVQKNKRLTLVQILQHPWMKAGKVNQKPLVIDFNKLKHFSKNSKLKNLSISCIASQIPQKQIHKLSILFKQMDPNSTGSITIQQLLKTLQSQKQNISFKQLKQIMDSIDSDKNGVINYTQFIACCLQNSIIHNQKYIKYVFNQFDKDKSGKITKIQFKDILKNTGVQQISGRLIQDIIRDCDQNGDGLIDYHQFLDTMITDN